jgi:bifunctional DNA-binding transcriptional regulator/antitoxin component of YhaV-PrlF toxin-antitoxin module
MEDSMDLKFQTKIDESGRIALPEKIISDLRLIPGTEFVVEERNGKVTLIPIEKEKEETLLVEKDGILVLRAQISEDITDMVKRDREARISQIIGDSFK